MMTAEQLTNYLKIYSRDELAGLLAMAVLTGETPVIPEDLTGYTKPYRQRGRPTAKVWQASLDRLRKAATEFYPNTVDLTTLAKQVGMTKVTLKKLQDDLEFLTTMQPAVADWYTALPVTSRGHLTPIWRAVLDLHYYALMVLNPQARLPLWRQHAVLWTNPLRPDPTYLTRRDAMERARVFKPAFKAVRRQLDWPEPLSPTYTPDEGEWPCTEGCPVLRAWANKVDLAYIPNARDVVGQLSYAPTNRYYISANQPMQALKQIVGAE